MSGAAVRNFHKTSSEGELNSCCLNVLRRKPRTPSLVSSFVSEVNLHHYRVSYLIVSFGFPARSSPSRVLELFSPHCFAAKALPPLSEVPWCWIYVLLSLAAVARRSFRCWRSEKGDAVFAAVRRLYNSYYIEGIKATSRIGRREAIVSLRSQRPFLASQPPVGIRSWRTEGAVSEPSADQEGLSSQRDPPHPRRRRRQRTLKGIIMVARQRVAEKG